MNRAYEHDAYLGAPYTPWESRPWNFCAEMSPGFDLGLIRRVRVYQVCVSMKC